MSSFFETPSGPEFVPSFEPLEERLLLTTIRGGEFFVYENSQNEAVRISLIGDREDAVEVFADHAHFGVVDLPGFYNGDPTDVVTWPAGESPTRQVWDANHQNSWYVWNQQGDTYLDPDGFQVSTTYGAQAEIFAIYVVNASPDTRLSISRVIPPNPAQPFTSGGGEAWYNRVDPWSGNVFNLATFDWMYEPNDVTDAPDNTGTVIVGARHYPLDDNQTQLRWVGVYGGTDPGGDCYETGVPQTGIFPGTAAYGPLYAGINVSDEAYRLASRTPLGRDVGSVAADDEGNVFAVDSSPFIGELINTSTSTGSLGDDVQAIAVNDQGTSYVADHSRQTALISTGTTAGAANALGNDLRTLAVYDNEFYAIEESNNTLLQIRPGNNEPVRSLGRVVDSVATANTFLNFIALETNPRAAGGELWGLAYGSADNALVLVKATIPGGVRTTVPFDRIAVLNTPEDGPWGANVVPGITAMAMRENSTTGLLEVWGVTGANQLVMINAGSGEVTLAGEDRVTGTPNPADFVLQTTGGGNVDTVIGLEFIGETLYAITRDEHLYRLDTAALATSSDIATDLGETQAPFAESLAYNAAQPARLFTITENNAALRLAAITVEASLESVDANGVGTIVGPLWDADEGTFAYNDVTGLDYAVYDPDDPANTDEFLYGLARISDLDPTGLPAAPEGVWIVRINEGNGQATRLARIVGPASLSSLAWNELNQQFYAIDPDNNQLYVLDPADIDDQGTPDSIDDVIDLTGQTTVTTGGTPVSLVSADFDGDTQADVAVLNQADDTVQIFLGNGDGTFTDSGTVAVGDGGVQIVAAQLSDDDASTVIDDSDNLDLVVVNTADGDVSILLGDGAGGFASAGDVAAGTDPSAVAVGDVNNDGNPDLAVANEGDDQAEVFLGNGNGTFGAGATFDVAGGPTGVTLADVDGNGNLDLITANGDDDSVSVLMGRGDGTFMEHEDYGPESVALGDLNGDGDTDLVVANRDGNTVSVLIGDGSGAFAGRWTYATGAAPMDVRLADMNGDGDLDAVTANQGGNNISVLLGDGSGGFGAATNTAVGAMPTDLDVGQIDNAGGLDVVVANRNDDTVTVLIGDGAGGFSGSATYNVGDSPSDVALGLMDGDAFNDIVVANQADDTVNVLVNDGAGGFTDAGVGSTFSVTTVDDGVQSPVGLAIGDADDDGTLDVVTANRLGETIAVLLGSGDGSLFALQLFPAGDSPTALALEDLTGDGAPEALVTDQVGDSVLVLMNNGDGTFTAPAADRTYNVGDNPATVVLGTVDGGSTLDLVSVGRGDDSAGVRLGEGSGTFGDLMSTTLGNRFDVGDNPVDVVAVDMDGDGNLDVLTANANDGSTQGTVSLLLGNGDGTFQAQTTQFTDIDPQQLLIDDLDGDGNWDILTANAGSDSVSARLGGGDGTFGGHLVYPVGTAPMSVGLADLDGDGQMDLLSANSGDDTLSVLLGNGDGSFGGELLLVGNTDPFVGIEWLTSPGGAQALLGVTASAAATPPTFDPPDSKLYTIDWTSGTVTELDDVNRYSPYEQPHIASLTSLAYSPLQPGYLWTTDRVIGYYDSYGNYIDDARVFIQIDDNGNEIPHLDTQDGDVLIERDMGYRLSRIRLSSALMNSNGQGDVDVQSILFDSDQGTHPFWIYDDVYALDRAPDGTLYAVAKARSLNPTTDPVDPGDPAATTKTWLVSIDTTFSLFSVDVVTRLAELPAGYEDVTTIAFSGDGTLYGVQDVVGGDRLFTFDQAGGTFTGAVTDIGLVSDALMNPLDLTGMDFQPDYVSALPGYGDGTFGMRFELATGNGPYLAPLVDLNGDGRVDLVTTNEFDDTFSVILSNPFSSTAYLDPVVYTVGDAPVSADFGKFNDDDPLDIVIANRDDDSVTVIFGGGNGTFQAVESAPADVLTAQLNDDDDDGDIDADDIPDIITVSAVDSTLTVLLGQAGGTYDGARSIYDVGTSPRTLLMGQLNDDNDDGLVNSDDWIDAITVNALDDTISVLLGNGNGTFAFPTTYDTGAVPFDGELVEVNGDGDLDVVVVNALDNTATVLLGDGDGGFAELIQAQPPTVGLAPTSLDMADLNGDGNLDIAAGNMLGTVTVIFGLGDGTFDATTTATYDVGSNPRDVTLVNLNDDNGDGFVNAGDVLDLVVGNYVDNEVSVLLGNADGTFDPETTFAAGTGPTSVTPASLNTDTDDFIDLVVTNGVTGEASVLTGNGDGTFNAPTAYTVGAGPVQAILSNVSGTATADLIVANETDATLSILEGSTDGTFGLQTVYDAGAVGTTYNNVGNDPSAVVVGDVNGDTIEDIVVANSNLDDTPGEDTVAVLIGNPDGTFNAPVSYAVGDRPVAVVLGDFNLDGWLDIATANNTADTVSILLGNGDGTFAAHVPYAAGDQPVDLALGDLNSDDVLDLVVANYGDGNVQFMLGAEDGTFAARQTLIVTGAPQSVELADLDGDGDLDIVAVSEEANAASVFLGKGDGFFSGNHQYAIENGPRSVRIGDMNSDGALEIVTGSLDDRFFGATADLLYEIDPATAILTEVDDGALALSGTVTGLGSNPLDSTFMWGTGQFGSGNIQNYYLLKIFNSADSAIQDMGTIRVSGTVAGRMWTAGNMGLIDIGFNWADTRVGRNLDWMVMRQGGGGRVVGTSVYLPYASTIKVGGTLNYVRTMGGTLYSSINVDNDADVFPMGLTFSERETYVTTEAAWHYYWIQGQFPRLPGSLGGLENNAPESAQFINHPTGTGTYYGSLSTLEETQTLPEEIPGLEGTSYFIDYVAIPMEAGQRVTLQGWFLLGVVWVPFYYSGNTAGGIKAHMFDSQGRWVAGNGYEMNDDYGVGSRYVYDSAELIDEQKPLDFVAREADIYYLAVIAPTAPWIYKLEIDTMPGAALGAVDIEGDYMGTLQAFAADNLPTMSEASPLGHYISNPFSPDDIVVEESGNLGAIRVAGLFGDGTTFLPSVHTIGGGGDLFALEGGTVAGVTVKAEGSIGRLASFDGDLGLSASAGFIGWQPEPYPYGQPYTDPHEWDAYIQTVVTVGSYGGALSATGSMGTMIIDGDFLASVVQVNSDEAGPVGEVDLIQVEGNWGSLMGVPTLYRGEDGDIGYVHVTGTIFQDFGAWIGQATPQRITDGDATNLYDDSGGQLTIDPIITQERDPVTGQPLTDADGNPIMHVPAYSYIIIGVDDFNNPGSGAGGVVARLTIDGNTSLSVTGDVKVGDLNMDYVPNPNVDYGMDIGGSGAFSVYYLNSTQPWDAYNNATDGDIVSGMLMGMGRIATGGDIGAQVSKLGTWVHGLDDAPVSADPDTEPQYGWHRGKVNGLQITGDVPEVSAGGFIRDLRVVGTLGAVVANADSITPGGEWHGVNGLIWSDRRIDSVAVGDGLADDGGVAKAAAGIMSGGTIGTVSIVGPRYVRNGVVFGEINGAVFGYINDIVNLVDQFGNTTSIERNSLGSIVGTNGAQLTAMVGGVGLSSFWTFTGSVSFLSGWMNGSYAGIGSISFSGAGAKIHGAEIAANYIGEVVAGSGSLGIEDSYISGDAARPDGLSVGRVAAGGPGMDRVTLSADGGDVGTIAGIDAVSDIYYSEFVVTDGGIDSVSARDLIETSIHAPKDLGSLRVTRDFGDVVSAGGSSTAYFLDGDGTGDFDIRTDSYPVGLGARDVALGDLNSDGWLDVVTVNDYRKDSYVTLLLSDEFGAYTAPIYYVTEAGPRAVELVDLNRDGHLDVVTANAKDNSVTILYGDGEGGFLDRRVFPAGEKPVALAVGDINGDGVADVVTANEESDDLSILINRGNGRLLDEIRVDAGDGPSSVIVGQLNDDNGDTFVTAADDLDIVVTNRLDDTATVLLGNGDGTFAAGVDYETGYYPMDLESGDLDNDGDLDLVVANRAERKVSILLGNGDGTFADQSKVYIGYVPHRIEVADFDADGNDDFVVAHEADDNMSVFLGAGDGTFTMSYLLELPSPVAALAVADMDFDGVLDIVPIARGDTVAGLLVGSIGSFYVGRDVTDSFIRVAGTVGSMKVGNRINSTDILLPGSAANLMYLEAAEDISGRIESHGRIGTIISRSGAIYAEINTTPEPGTPSNDVGRIVAEEGLFGWVDIAGSLNSLEVYTSLGVDPRDEGVPQEIVINGDLGVLRVVRRFGDPEANLFANVSVGGSIVSRVDVDGTLFGDLKVNGDANFLMFDGNLGFLDAGTGTTFGSVEVLGDLHIIRFATQGDLVADIISGGSLRNLTILNGNVEGDIVSRYGDILGLTVINGNVNGNVRGRSISFVNVIGRDPGTGDITGDLTATNGGIGRVTVSNGNILGNIDALNGSVDLLQVIRGNLGSAATQTTASATQGFGRINVILGDLLMDVLSRGKITGLMVNGNVTDVEISSTDEIGLFYVLGNNTMTGSTVRSAAGITRTFVQGDVTDSILSSGRDLDYITVLGDVTDSMFLAGWDTGWQNVSHYASNGDGTMTARPMLNAGADPRAVTMGDLNGDGYPDLVVANFDDDDISVRFNDGLGSFGPQVRYTMGDGPTAAVLADLDGDGNLDVLTANHEDDTVSTRLGDGAGGFGAEVVHAVGDGPRGLAVEDLTAGTDPDLLIAHDGDDTLWLVEGEGDGTFDVGAPEIAALPVGSGPVSIAVGDLDGLNQIDFAVAREGDGWVTVFLHDGVSSYVQDADYGVGTAPQSVDLGDADGDGDLDFVTANRGSDNVSVWLNNGDGTFAGAALYATGDAPTDARFVNMNADALPDIVTTDRDDGTISVLAAVGGGAYGAAAATTTAPLPQALAHADIDQDGDDDIIAVHDTTRVNPLNGGNAHAGRIRNFYISGDYNSSVTAAGIGPGPDGDFTTTGDNTVADGSSTIDIMRIAGTVQDTATSAFLADTSIYQRLLDGLPGSVVVPAQYHPTATPTGDGNDFGPSIGLTQTVWDDGAGFTIALRGGLEGMAHYDPATRTLTLKRTTNISSLVIRYTGAGQYAGGLPVTIVGAEDSGLALLQVLGDVVLGDVDIDGPIRTMYVPEVAAGSTWNLPGGVLVTQVLSDVTNLTVDAGEMRTVIFRGQYAGGSFTADEVSLLQTWDAASADITVTLGGLRTLMIRGDYGGEATVFGTVYTAQVLGDFTGGLDVLYGDLFNVMVWEDWTGVMNVRRGEVRTATVLFGEFGGQDDSALHSAGGVWVFNVVRGDLSGILNTDGNIRVLSAALGEVSGRIRSAGSITSVLLGSMDGGIVTAGNDLLFVTILGDMSASSLYAGFDPGYDPNGNPLYNVELDGLTPTIFRTAANDDEARGGRVASVVIRGNMAPEYDATRGTWTGRGSTIAAGIDPGNDGYAGTYDDVVRGAGTVDLVRVFGGIYGNGNNEHLYGVFAASEMPRVYHQINKIFNLDVDDVTTTDVGVGMTPSTVGPLRVERAVLQARSLVVQFNHAVNLGTLNTGAIDPSEPTTFAVYIPGDPTPITDQVANVMTWDPVDNVATLTLTGSGSWTNLPGNPSVFTLVLDGSRITDPRGVLLDGDADGTPGGDYTQVFTR